MLLAFQAESTTTKYIKTGHIQAHITGPIQFDSVPKILGEIFHTPYSHRVQLGSHEIYALAVPGGSLNISFVKVLLLPSQSSPVNPGKHLQRNSFAVYPT